MSATSVRDEFWTRLGIRAWATIGVLILLGAAGWLLGTIFSALVPFALGLVIMLLLRHPVEWMASRGLNRTLAVLACYVAAVVVVTILIMFIAPPIYDQIAKFVSAVPDYANRIYALWDKAFIHPGAGNQVPAWAQSAANSLRDQIVAGAGQWSAALAAGAVSTGSSIASGVIAFVLALIIGFYALVDLPRLREEVMLLVGPSGRRETVRVLATVSRVLGGWLKGTLIQSTVVAILFTILLSLLGVPYALAIGVFGGILNVVPYLGPAITALLAGGAGLFVSPWVALWAVVAVFAVQQFDSLFMAPRIMSEQVDLHPLLVILSLLVGATLFGVPGMVLSVPIAAIVKGLFVYWFENRTSRQICTDDGVLFRMSKDDREDAVEAGSEPVAGSTDDASDAPDSTS